MNYAIAVSTNGDGLISWTVLSLFDDDHWGRLLDLGLKVTTERWAEWQLRRGDLVVAPDLPNLSRLAHIDEGTVSFHDLISLRAECIEVLSRATDLPLRKLLEHLIRATILAEKDNGAVHVFPAASGEREGD